MSRFVIELKKVSKSYGGQTVLKDIDLQVESGEFLTLLGPSGCGKTTILRLLAGFEQPTSGTIYIDGRDMRNRAPERRQVNTVFQSYALFPHMSVFDNVAFGPRINGLAGQILRERVMEALRMVKLEELALRKPEQLSGGQQQRVAIARAVINRPLVLLLDEPLSALDFKLRKAMQIELKQLQRKLGITFVFVTHDQEEALSMSDRVAVMNAGRIEQIGTPRQIYEAPSNLFVARFVGEINLLRGTIVAANLPYYTIDWHGKQISLKTERRFPIGAKVGVLVRPEDLRIGRADNPQQFPARVEEVIYKGTTVDLIVRLENGDLLAATQFFNENAAGSGELDYTIGERVLVDWVHGWEVILPDED